MSKSVKDPAVYVVDMIMELEHIALFCTQGKRDDLMTNYALMRAFTVLGEAAKRVPDDERDKTPLIPWNKIIGVRNLLSHEYEEIHIERLWNIVDQELPALQKQLNHYTHY